MKLKLARLTLTLFAASLLLSQVYAAAKFTPDFQPLGHIGPVQSLLPQEKNIFN